MSKYKDLAAISSAIGVIFALIIGIFAKDWLADIINKESPFLVLVIVPVIFIIIALSKIPDIVIKHLIKKSETIRKRLLGRQYLDGTWIDRVKYNE